MPYDLLMAHLLHRSPLGYLGLALLVAGGCKQGGDEPAEASTTGATATATATTGAAGGTDAIGSGGTGSGGGGASGDGGAGGEEATSTGGGGGAAAGWTVSTHSCSATSRTDALLVEDDAMWVGCGTTQVGYGLHRSDDGGQTWQEVSVTPDGDMDQFRVSVIRRGEDGELYVAGIDANDGQMIVRLDTTAEPYALSEVLNAGNQVGQSFHVGSFEILPSGQIFAESLTGYGALVREDPTEGPDAGQWTDAYYWAADDEGYQMLDLALDGSEALYGVGSTIAEPPYVFLPPRAASNPFRLEPVELPNDGWTGEMWGVAVSEGRVLATGVDQTGHHGKIFVSGADPYDSDGYTVHELDDIVAAGPLGSWGRGACARGDRLVVVGERQPLSGGTSVVVISDDGGQTFEDITPEGTGESMTRCQIHADDSVIVTGAASFFGIYR